MDIRQRTVTVRELVAGYSDDGQGGVVGYRRRLDIRPPFQREFVYEAAQRDAVIDTIWRGFPLNSMYWADVGDGRYEVIDGQQRTISIAQYVRGEFSHLPIVGGHARFFDNLTEAEQDRILDYELTVYICAGTPEEKLEWFQVINIAGMELKDQELRNAVYHGPWLSDAKRWFSRPGCPASDIGRKYLRGDPLRQEYLETAIRWAALDKGTSIEEHMAARQNHPDAEGLWRRFRAVIDWVETTFRVYRTKMKGVDWGTLHHTHKNDLLDPEQVEEETARLVADSEVTRQAGIYLYILTREERHLNLRTFDKNTRQRVYEAQGGRCKICDDPFPLKGMDADHRTPWSEGGQTVDDNCQMLCKPCNRRKGAQ